MIKIADSQFWVHAQDESPIALCDHRTLGWEVRRT